MENLKRALNAARLMLPTAILAVCITACGLRADAGTRFRTTRIERIARATKIDRQLATLQDSVYKNLTYEGVPLSVRVENGQMTHIGHAVFTEAQRAVVPVPVADFIERLSLELALPDTAGMTPRQRLEVDGISIYPDYKALARCNGDTTLTLAVRHTDGKHYEAAWMKGDVTACRILFPSSQQLMRGTDMLENERLLIDDIISTPPTLAPPTIADASRLDTLDNGIRVQHGAFHRIAVVNADRYYDSLNVLLFTSDHPVESMANLLLTNEIANNFTTRLIIDKYGGLRQEITVPLDGFLSFLRAEGCRTYFGIMENDIDGKRIVGLLEAVNDTWGYEHLMKVTMHADDMDKGEGCIEIELTPYIPTHQLKDMYKDRKAY